MSVQSVGRDCAYKAAKVAVNNVIRSRYTAEGRDAIPEKEPFVIFAHHMDATDIIEDSNLTQRRLSFLAKSEYFDLSFSPVKLAFALALRATGQINFERKGRNIEQVYTGIERAVSEGAGVVIYPSGTRSRLNVIGPAGPLVIGLTGYLIELSKTYSPMHFIAVGRTERIFDGRRDVAVVCEESATAYDGQVLLPNPTIQARFDAANAENKAKGLEVLVNGHIMPRISALSGKMFEPGMQAYVRNELRKRREKGGGKPS